jgi:hypothetical protein
VEDSRECFSDLAQIVRLAIVGESDDVRLYVARLIRKYRATNPDLAEQLESYLRARPSRSSSPLRRLAPPPNQPIPSVPVDEDSRLSLLRKFHDTSDREKPLLSAELAESLMQLMQERKQVARLLSAGLTPTRSAIFVGPPGVGKTLTARWLASQLGVPLYVLDLAAVMSSLLGRSGSNLRSAIDFAKREPCVLLLDEIDAIAKRRSDDTDIGELKRLVTVILQEVDEWPATGLLLAATNHPDLIDPALWRRFDLVLTFDAPEQSAVKVALRQFLGPDLKVFDRWLDALALAFKGKSFSDIERETQRFRRAVALKTSTPDDLSRDLVKLNASALARPERIQLAIALANLTRLSQHEISDITGVSRDTIRRHVPERDDVGRRRARPRAAA